MKKTHKLPNKRQKTLKLPPCPFCGETEDIAIKRNKYNGDVVEINGLFYWYVECLPCDARTGYCFDGDATLEGFSSGREMAIYKWSMRHEPKEIGLFPQILTINKTMEKSIKIYCTSLESLVSQINTLRAACVHSIKIGTPDRTTTDMCYDVHYEVHI